MCVCTRMHACKPDEHRSCYSVSELCPALVTPWTAALQPSLSFTISQSFLKLMSIESMMSSNHLILCCPLLLLPSIFPRIRVFSSESALHLKWPKYWSFSIRRSRVVQGWFPLGLTNQWPPVQLSYPLVYNVIDKFYCRYSSSIWKSSISYWPKSFSY